jgi:hypothetical protein
VSTLTATVVLTDSTGATRTLTASCMIGGDPKPLPLLALIGALQ